MAADMNLAVEKLNDFNYEVWKFRIDLLLIRDGLKKIVDEPKPAHPDAGPDYECHFTVKTKK